VVRLPACESWQGCILHVPTVDLFRGGEVVKQVIGARSKSALLREFAEFF